VGGGCSEGGIDLGDGERLMGLRGEFVGGSDVGEMIGES
jgi:hypothetical protein